MNLPSRPGPSSQPSSPPPDPRFAKIRTWLRSRSGRIIVPSVALLLGILIGVVAILLYAVAISGDEPFIVTPPPPRVGSIMVQVDSIYLAQLVQQNLRASGMPGEVGNVRVTLVHGNKMTITGDDQFSLLGIGVTRQFMLVVQPYVSSCSLQIQVIHADVSKIPVTGVVQAFEASINAQLRTLSPLPKGFTYCATGVHTEPNGMFIIYSATPQS